MQICQSLELKVIKQRLKNGIFAKENAYEKVQIVHVCPKNVCKGPDLHNMVFQV